MTRIESDFTKREVLEGLASGNQKAKFGRSKEKRSDCRLLTLGLVIDGKGFPKTSKVFSGNQSEPKTLLGMIDAGIATEDNLSEFIADFVHKKGCTKNYQKVCECIGRLKENRYQLSVSCGEVGFRSV